MVKKSPLVLLLSLPLTIAFCFIVARPIRLSAGGAIQYIAELSARTGALNLVAAVYLDGRLYDTIFEVIIFAVAVLGVRFYLAEREPSDRPVTIPESHVVRASAEVLFPFLLLLGIYLAAYGHLSPGGGFAGGTVAATGLLLCAIAVGGDLIARRIRQEALERLEWGLPLAILLFALLPLFLGRPLLSAPFPVGRGFFGSGSILLYNLLIGLKVFIGSWVIIHGFIEHRGGV